MANEGGGVAWSGVWPFAFIDGTFKANRGLYSGGSIVWGSKGDGGVAGGGPSFDGCTRFEDDSGNFDYFGVGGFGCTPSASRRRALGGTAGTAGTTDAADVVEAAVQRRQLSGVHRRLAGLSAAAFGITTPMANVSVVRSWQDEAEAVSGGRFPNTTRVLALDVYGSIVPTADDAVVALPGPDGMGATSTVCDDCAATANFVAGVALLPQLGLVAMPGTQASVSFQSGTASPSPPMSVSMRQCRPGEYLDAGARLCRACEAGRFSNVSGAVACTACFAGFYQPAAGASACLGCAMGSASGARGQLACAPCAVGQAQGLTGQSTCDDCPAGRYQDNTGASECKACGQGDSQPVAGQAACAACVAGKYGNLSGATRCFDCPVGTYADGLRTVACKLCAAGTFQLYVGRDACDPCPGGKFASGAGSTACDSCAAGRYAEETGGAVGASRCKRCAEGESQPSTLQPYALRLQPQVPRLQPYVSRCAEGESQPATGRTKCDACEPGSFDPAAPSDEPVSCTACPAGRYSDAARQTSCKPCALGWVQPAAGKQACDVCEAGKFMQTAELPCQSCLPGSFSAASETSCTPCPAGLKQDKYGQGQCDKCDEFTFSNEGQANCTACHEGASCHFSVFSGSRSQPKPKPKPRPGPKPKPNPNPKPKPKPNLNRHQGGLVVAHPAAPGHRRRPFARAQVPGASHLQPHVMEAATICDRGCNHRWQRLSPCVTRVPGVQAAQRPAHLPLPRRHGLGLPRGHGRPAVRPVRVGVVLGQR